MPNIHIAPNAPKLDVIDQYGEPMEADLGADLEPVVELHMSTVEYELWGLLNSHRGMLNALKKMVLPGQTAAGAFNAVPRDPNIADNTVTFLRNEAERVYFKIASTAEKDIALIGARGMLKSYIVALGQVDVRRDSTPGVRLANLWRWCTWHLLRADASQAEKDEAVVRWRDGRKDALKR